MKNKKRIPKIGEKLKAFDDGKIKPSRMWDAEIIDVIPFDEFLSKNKIGNQTTEKLLKVWEKEVKDCAWLYAKSTDYFIITTPYFYDENFDIFARTHDGGWFSFGKLFGCSRLDVDNMLYNNMLQYFELKNNTWYWKE